MSWFGWVRQRALGISADETSFAKRGFPAGSPAMRQHLERAAGAFVVGYNQALRCGSTAALVAFLEDFDRERRGFAYEGAGMAAWLLDRLTPWRRDRFASLLAACDERHIYMLYVGAGWAIARLPWARRRFERSLGGLDPLLRWLAIDGYGFHQGFFDWRRSYEEHFVPAGLSAYGRRAFDQGLGRCLWFVGCGDAARIAETIERSPQSRRGDLWSGIGLASTYAGGCDAATLNNLHAAGKNYAAELAQGAAFAAKARLKAGNATEHMESACRVYCGCAAEVAAAATDECRIALPPDGDEPSFEAWRRRIQAQLVDAARTSGHDGDCAKMAGRSAPERGAQECRPT